MGVQFAILLAKLPQAVGFSIPFSAFPMRLNRALTLLAMAVATGLGVIWFESRNLRLEQKLAELDRQHSLLLKEQSRLRLDISRVASPSQVIGHASRIDGFEAPRVPTSERPRSNLQPYWNR